MSCLMHGGHGSSVVVDMSILSVADDADSYNECDSFVDTLGLCPNSSPVPECKGDTRNVGLVTQCHHLS
jgi:hypothetical protein